MAVLEGIRFNQNEDLYEWSAKITPWVEEVISDVAEGIGGDVGVLLDKQQKYTAYAGAMVEIYAKASALKSLALAEAMQEAIKEGTSASLVARIAEGKIVPVIQFYEAVHKLNSNLSDQLIAIASRLRFERNLAPGEQKPPF